MSDTNQEIPCEHKLCQSNPHSMPERQASDGNSQLHDRPVLYLGVVWVGIMRRFLFGGSSPCEPFGILEPRSPDVPKEMSNQQSVLEPRTNPESAPQNSSVLFTRQMQDSDTERSSLSAIVEASAQATRQVRETSAALVEASAQARRHVQETSASALKQVQAASVEARRLSDDIGDFVRNTATTISETAGRPESARVTVSWAALLGYTAGLRRGLLERLVYTATAATAAAIVCWPVQAEQYNTRLIHGIEQVIATLRSSLEHSGNISESHPSRQSSSEKSLKMKQNFQNIAGKQQIGNIYRSEVDDGIPGRHQEGYLFSGSNRPLDDNKECKERSREECDTWSKHSGLGVQRLPLPYSPALPVPPIPHDSSKTKLRFHEENSADCSDPLKDNMEEICVCKGNQHSDSEGTSSLGKASTVNSACDTGDASDAGEITTPSQSTIGLEDHEVKEEAGDYRQFPMNKKLSRYYMVQDDDSPPQGLDDLHSKHKRTDSKHSTN